MSTVPSCPWPDMSIPGSINSSRSRSSTGSWESSSSSSHGNTPPPELAQEYGFNGPSSHRSVWEKYNREKIIGPELYDNDDIFWQEVSNGGVKELLGNNKHDLLDRLVMEDQEEKMRNSNARELFQSGTSHEMENLIKLLQLQQMTRPTIREEGRPIIGSHAVPTSNFGLHAMPNFFSSSSPLSQRMKTHDNAVQSTRYSHSHNFSGKGRFLPVNFKVPPPEHPPAIPVSSTHHFHNCSNIEVKHPIPLCPPSPGSAAAIQLRMLEATWQFQTLEKERKKTEAALAKQNPGKKVSSNNAVQVPRLPLSPTKLDKLLVDSLREQSRVLTLLNRVEVIEKKSFSQDLFSNLAMWKQKIQVVMMIRRRERLDQDKNGNGEQLDESIAFMSAASRKVRTVLWMLLFSRERSY